MGDRSIDVAIAAYIGLSGLAIGVFAIAVYGMIQDALK